MNDFRVAMIGPRNILDPEKRLGHYWADLEAIHTSNSRLVSSGAVWGLHWTLDTWRHAGQDFLCQSSQNSTIRALSFWAKVSFL